MLNKIIEKMLFYPTKSFIIKPDYFSLEYEDVYFSTEDKLKLHGWYFPTNSEEIILFFHGNAGNIADRLDNVNLLVTRGFSVFIIDYRGYGLSEGYPSEKGTYKDAFAAWKLLNTHHKMKKKEKRCIFGRSLGGAIALKLASEINPERLIIESTFTSIRDLGHQLIPLIPKALIPLKYPNTELIKQINSPILIIHGTNDSLIPFSHGKKLFEIAKSPKKFFPIESAEHNDTYLVNSDEYFSQLTQFILNEI